VSLFFPEKSADGWYPRRDGALSREIGENSALAPIIFLAALGERGFFLRKSANGTSVARKNRHRLFLENPRKLPTLGAEVNPWRNKSARGFSCFLFVPRKIVRNGAEFARFCLTGFGDFTAALVLKSSTTTSLFIFGYAYFFEESSDNISRQLLLYSQ
jgi:hypothetical protein